MITATPPHQSTLRRLVEGKYRLHAWCAACHHDAILSPMRLAQRAGWEAILGDLQKALTWRRCGRRAPHVSAVPWSLPDWKVAPWYAVAQMSATEKSTGT